MRNGKKIKWQKSILGIRERLFVMGWEKAYYIKNKNEDLIIERNFLSLEN